MIGKQRAALLKETAREFYNNTLWDYAFGRYRESKHFSGPTPGDQHM